MKVRVTLAPGRAVRIEAPRWTRMRRLEGSLTLEVPEVVVLADGTTVHVKAVAAIVVYGGFTEITFTVEKPTGAWAEVASDEVRAKPTVNH